MKSFFVIASGVALANTALAQFTNQSQPFFLVIDTPDCKYNGTTLRACHEGAAIEGLCAGGTFNASAGYETYTFNTSTFFDQQTGLLTYELIESESMTLDYDPSTNVAIALFQPSESYTYVGFDSNNEMFLQSYYDDTVTPPVGLSSPKAYYRWYICETDYTGYIYETLCWVMGKYPPQNPSCVEARIIRQFV